jgi:hypothetical protein
MDQRPCARDLRPGGGGISAFDQGPAGRDGAFVADDVTAGLASLAVVLIPVS